MFKKTKSTLAMTLSAAMVASMVVVPGVASAATGTQLSGKDRYETALKIVQDGWDKSESAVIARGDDLADALSAAPLAYAKGKAPILLTKTNEIPAGVLQELKDLGVKNVYIVGGVGAVSKTVADQLAGQGLTITRVQGDDRYETSLAVAKEAFGAAPADVVIANGLAYADALSVSSIAASKGMPILLVDHSKLSAEQSTYIAGKSVYAVGGEGVLNADVVSVTKATRLAGADRYSTNAAVLAKFDFDYTKLYIAKGTPANLVDSLAGSALASKTNSPIVLVDGSNKLDTKLATVVTDKIKDDTAIVRLGGTVAQSTADAVEALKSATNVGELKVSAVSAISASAIKVAFNKAPSDTSKVVIEVKKGTTPVTMVAAWNNANTEATLTGTSNLAEGSYTVNVMDGTTDLGTSTVVITKQKVAKIEILGDTVAVAPTTTVDDKMVPGHGYVSYKVLDQYGVDITSLSLASKSNINWNSSIGSVDASKGLLDIKSYSDTVLLTQYTSTIITAINQDSNISTSSTLKVSLSQGTLSDIKLNKLTNVDDKALTQGNSISKFYLDYTALDISANETKNMTLLEKGLLDSDPSEASKDVIDLYSSNPNLVTAKLVEDPTDSSKGSIEVVTVEGSAAIFADTPIIITAMTKTGKSSSINLTLKKASTLDKIDLSLPAQELAVGDTNVEIPYEAFDQDGNKLTKFKDIVGATSASTELISSHAGLVFTKNADGTLKITIAKVLTGTTVYQIVTKTGKNSMITVKAQDAAASDTLKVDTTSIKQYMQKGVVQMLDFGYDAGGLSINDQYGRAIDLENSNLIGTDTYTVKAVPSVGGIIDNKDADDVNQTVAFMGNQIAIHAVKEGTQTVKFVVYKNGVATDITKTVSFTVVKDEDIVDFESDTVDTMYANETPVAGYGMSTPDVFGKLSTGTLVALADGSIKNGSVNNNSFTKVGTKIIASKITNGSTEATGSYTTTVLVNGEVSTVTTALKSSTVAPIAASVGMDLTATTIGGTTGISMSGDTITLTGNAMVALLSNSNTLYKYNNGVVATHLGNIDFYAKDQYGTKGQTLAYSTLVSNKYSIDSATGKLLLTSGNVTAGDEFNLTVVAASGALKTVKFEVSSNATDVLAVDKAKLTTAVADATTNSTSAVISTDGKDVLNTNKWVTPTEKTTYTDAIALADGIAKNITSTQAQLDDSFTTLGNATTVFNNLKKVGSVVNGAFSITQGKAAVTGVAATGTIAFGTPVLGDKVKVNGTEFKYVTTIVDAATDYTNITELEALVEAVTGVDSVVATTNIELTATPVGIAGNDITLSKTGTGTTTVSGAKLVGGIDTVIAVNEKADLTMAKAFAAGNLEVTVNGVVKTVVVTAGESAIDIATAVSSAFSASVTGYTVASTGTAVVTFTSTASGSNVTDIVVTVVAK
ncbi:cell wall-binding repeat-containing protein [Clostridium sp.]